MLLGAEALSSNTMNQLCKVCGEPAAGFHFGAFTCEGCKSFFGRTYNNLSQVHECKNGGQCVINKQNRTSCKACRLRKCLMVGMSKSGSRYGRRSNWFKIHCLLQEQAAYNGGPMQQVARTAITPTLQDGSLPFVSQQLRDALSQQQQQQQDGGTGPPPSRPPLPPLPGVSELHQAAAMQSSFSNQQLNAVERRLQEEALAAIARNQARIPQGTQDLESQYRLLEAFRRSQETMRRNSDLESFRRVIELDSLRRNQDMETIDVLRQMGPEMEARIGPLALLEWERKIRENSRRSDADITLERKSTPADVIKNFTQDEMRHSATNQKIDNCISEAEVVSTVKDEDIKIEFDCTKPISETKEDHANKQHCGSPGIKLYERKPDAILISEEERLSFLKAASSPSHTFQRDPVSAVSNASPVVSSSSNSATRIIPPSADALYSSLNNNNNLFPFAAYPPFWPSMLQFPPLAKFYPPFAGNLPSPPIEAFKNLGFPIHKPTSSRSPQNGPPREDAFNKKRFLDAVLQVQRGSPSPAKVELPSSSVKRRASPTESPSPTPLGPHDQPMDLTIRRKRKMDKREIMYKPGEDDYDEEIEGLLQGVQMEDTWKKREETIEDIWRKREEGKIEEKEKVDETWQKSEELKMEEITEVPLKFMKLADSPGETLII
ncbi:unnamed protein product, partial [Meganyctiphanes norvegica]